MFGSHVHALKHTPTYTEFSEPSINPSIHPFIRPAIHRVVFFILCCDVRPQADTHISQHYYYCIIVIRTRNLRVFISRVAYFHAYFVANLIMNSFSLGIRDCVSHVTHFAGKGHLKLVCMCMCLCTECMKIVENPSRHYSPIAEFDCKHSNAVTSTAVAAMAQAKCLPHRRSLRTACIRRCRIRCSWPAWSRRRCVTPAISSPRARRCTWIARSAPSNGCTKVINYTCTHIYVHTYRNRRHTHTKHESIQPSRHKLRCVKSQIPKTLAK